MFVRYIKNTHEERTERGKVTHVYDVIEIFRLYEAAFNFLNEHAFAAHFKSVGEK